MKEYDPFNWYWKVNGSATHVYSSAVGDYVPVTDPAFVAWTADGTLPTNIVSAAELGEVLAPYNLRPAEAVVLDAYQDTHAKKITIEAVAKLLFNIVNEIRVLKGQEPITAQQFRTYVKGLM
jgi:hypothetical protein